MVQWLGLCASDAGSAGSIPGQETKIPHTMVQDQEVKQDRTKLDYPNLESCQPLFYTMLF